MTRIARGVRPRREAEGRMAPIAGDSRGKPAFAIPMTMLGRARSERMSPFFGNGSNARLIEFWWKVWRTYVRTYVRCRPDVCLSHPPSARLRLWQLVQPSTTMATMTTTKATITSGRGFIQINASASERGPFLKAFLEHFS